LVCSLGFAQQRTGNIFGAVVDEDNVALPGVTVTLTSELTADMTFITNDKGGFRFISLSPGQYAIRAELEGFAPVSQEGIVVSTGTNVTLKLPMRPAAISEEITVTADTPVVDTRQTTIATHFDATELQNMPTARDPFVILQLSPGVMVDRENVGGSESGQQSRYVSRGSGRASSTWNLDGIDTTDQVSEGAASQYYDFDAFDEIQIQTAATDITAFTAGTQINLVTKRGSNTLSGGGRAYYSGQNLQWSNTPDAFEGAENKTDTLADLGFNVGGPIIRDKLWLWTGLGYQDIRVIDTADVTVKTRLINWETKLNASLGIHRIEAFFNLADNPKDGRVASSPLDAYEARYKQTAPKPIGKIQDEITFSEDFFFSLKASYAGFGFKLEPIGGFDTIAYRDNATDTYWNSYRYGSDYGRDQYFGQALGILFNDSLFNVSHEFKFGAEFKHSYGLRDRLYNPQYLRYRDISTRTSYRAYIYRPNSNYDYRINRLGLFFQDTINVKRFTFLAMLRYDRQWGNTKEVTVPGSSVDWAGENNLPGVTVKAQSSNIVWNTFSPRLGIIYDLTGDGKTSIKLNWGLYGGRYDSSFLSNLASTYGYAYWNWNDKNDDMLVQTDEISRYRVSDSYKVLEPDELYDSNMTSPLVMEVTAGVEREIFPNFALGGTFIWRKNYNDYWSINYLEDGDTLRLPTENDWEVVDNIPAEYGGWPIYDYKPGLDYSSQDYTFQRPDYYQRFLAFEISFRKRFSASSPWLINGSFTYQDWRRYYPTRASYNSPNNIEQMDGNYAGYISGSSGGTDQSINPRWMGKMGFAVQVPWQINVGGTMIVRDGYILRQTYVDYDIDLEYNDSNPSIFTKAYGTDRLPVFFMLNLRVDKTLRIQNRVALTFSLDLFNVFNVNTTLSEEDTVNRSNYGQIIQYTQPRILRLGFTFKF